MGDDFKVGDVVVCVAEDVCPFHSAVPDDCPEMIGKTFRVSCVIDAWFEDCIGSVRLGGVPDEWCIGTLRKIRPADDRFIRQLRALTPKEDNHA